jgi:hypothetical protein
MDKQRLFTVEEVAEIIRSATRIGPALDTPEGSRYIIISDTLAGQMVESLDAINANFKQTKH